MKLILNIIAGLIGFYGLIIAYAIVMSPFLIALFVIFLIFDSIFNMYSFIFFWFILNGIFLGWSYVKKDKVYFYSIVVYTIAIGAVLLGNFEPYFDQEMDYYDSDTYYSTLLPIVFTGLLSGFVLFKLGFITFLQEVWNLYSHIKYDETPIRWLAIYYRCKLKKLKVYLVLHEGYKCSYQTVIKISNSGEYSVGKNLEKKNLSLGDINNIVISNLKSPYMEIVIEGAHYAPAKAVYKLVSLILIHQSDDVGLKPQGSSKSFFDNYWEKNFNDKN